MKRRPRGLLGSTDSSGALSEGRGSWKVGRELAFYLRCRGKPAEGPRASTWIPECCLIPTSGALRVSAPSALALSPELQGRAGREFSWGPPSTPEDGKWWIKPPVSQLESSRRPPKSFSGTLVRSGPSDYHNDLSNVPFGQLGPFLCLPLLAPSRMLPGINSQINYLPQSPCLRVCCGGSPY